MDNSFNRNPRSLPRDYISGQRRDIASLLDRPLRVQPQDPPRNSLLPGSIRDRLLPSLIPDPRSQVVSSSLSRRDIRLPQTIGRFQNPEDPSSSSLLRQEGVHSLRNLQGGPNESQRLISERDREMASRQTRIDSLRPDQRKEQEKWAQDQLRGYKGACMYGYGWKRVQGGYQCEADICFVTDELLAEGRGGYYRLVGGRGRNSRRSREGPFYGSIWTARPYQDTSRS